MHEAAPQRQPEELVAELANPDLRFAAYSALNELGPHAVPAIHDGLRHGNWQVRRWCAILLDHHGTAESVELLKPLLRDPKSDVRLWAVHSLACDGCKDFECSVDLVPLLIDRVEFDESIRVRRMATVMLAHGKPDRRAVPVFRTLLDQEDDRKLRLHAGLGLQRARDAGLV